jgi:hypothetical protein
MMGIEQPQEWLDRFAVTLGPYICVPWTPGEGSQKALKRQLVVLAHECGHVEQWRRNPLGFAFNYATSDTFRGHAEAECLQTNLEVGFALNGKTPSINYLVKTLLEWYFISPEVGLTAKKNLTMYAKIVEHGAVGTAAGKAAIKFLG